MENTAVKKTKGSGFFSNLVRQQMFIPVAALVILAVFNLIADPSFFKITLGYSSSGAPVLSGYLITILDYGSELAIHRRQGDSACTLWFQFQTGDTSYLSFGGIFGSMSCIYVIWSIQRCSGSLL